MTFLRSFWLAILALAPAVASPSTGQERALAAGASLIGQPAPALVVQTLDGQRVDLAQWYGKKAVYLKFWATWCVPCREQMPHLERTFENEGSDLRVIAIDTGFNETRNDVAAYRRELGLKMPIVIDDGRLAAAFHLRVTPQHVVIGRDGRIAYVGHLVDPPLEAALKAAPRAPVAAAIPVAAAASEPAFKAGDRVSGLSLVDVDGQTLSALDTVQRRPLALFFLSPWCESYFEQSRPARAGACRSMRTQIESLAADPGVRWVGIASGLWATREEVVEYRDQYKIGFPLVLDESGALFRSFQVNEVPVVVILGADARVERRIEEGSDLRAALLAARPSAR